MCVCTYVYLQWESISIFKISNYKTWPNGYSSKEKTPPKRWNMNTKAKEPVNKPNPELLYNKQKLQLLPSTNELTTHIMGKETPLLFNTSPRVPHKAAKFKALFPS